MLCIRNWLTTKNIILWLHSMWPVMLFLMSRFQMNTWWYPLKSRLRHILIKEFANRATWFKELWPSRSQEEKSHSLCCIFAFHHFLLSPETLEIPFSFGEMPRTGKAFFMMLGHKGWVNTFGSLNFTYVLMFEWYILVSHGKTVKNDFLHHVFWL